MSDIGLPKGMSRDDAYVQGMADAEAVVERNRLHFTQQEGLCPASWTEFENQLPRPGTRYCEQCGSIVHIIFGDKDNTIYHPVHTINVRCRWCGSHDVKPSGSQSAGTAMVECRACSGVGVGNPSN
jgi:hypothetical protein